MKTIVALLFALTLFGQSGRLPEQFHVVERYFALNSTFDVATEFDSFAVARKRFFAVTTTFDLEDIYQRPLATATSRFFAWGTVADVTDPDGKKLGWIEEELFRILPWAEYRVFDATNRLVAIAKMNFLGTHFELTHPDNFSEIYATISRPFLRLCRDEWTVQIHNLRVFEEGIIDPRLLVLLSIYQTDKDNRDRLRNQLLDQLAIEQTFQDGRRTE